MTTRYMRRHANDLPKKKKPRKRLKPIVKKIVYAGQVRHTKQAEVLQKALGWMDTQQFQDLALDVVKTLHEMGFRIATKSSVVVPEKGSK